MMTSLVDTSQTPTKKEPSECLDPGSTPPPKNNYNTSKMQLRNSSNSSSNGSSSTKNTKNPTSLPYNGDLQEAMRKQDRPAIRILMQHQQKQQEKEMEQNSASDSSQGDQKSLRQISISPCSLNCGDNTAENLVKLPNCEHEMHVDCLEGLLCTRSSTCPLCRASIECLRKNHHFTKIDQEIEAAWAADLARAMAASSETTEE